MGLTDQEYAMRYVAAMRHMQMRRAIHDDEQRVRYDRGYRGPSRRTIAAVDLNRVGVQPRCRMHGHTPRNPETDAA